MKSKQAEHKPLFYIMIRLFILDIFSQKSTNENVGRYTQNTNTICILSVILLYFKVI